MQAVLRPSPATPINAQRSLHMNSQQFHAMKKKCVVIGAGFAGLGAARRLQLAGGDTWEVTVLEASRRVGGRAHTVELPGCGNVEMGATWLHGLRGNPLYAFAVESGIMSAHASQKDEAWGRSSWVREGEQHPLSKIRQMLARTAAGSYSMAVQRSLESDEPGLTVGQHLRRTWPEAFERLQSQHLAAEVWAWREKLQRSIDGCTTTDDMLAAGLAAYDELDELNVPVPGGFQGIAQRLAEGLDVCFGKSVAKIEWRQEGARVLCSDGHVIGADAVIITVSLGVLQEMHEALFTPPLPASKIAAISRMGMGTVNKVFLSGRLPEGQSPQQQASSYSLLWRLPSNAADSWAEHACAQPDDRPAWVAGAYALRMHGSEFVASLPPQAEGTATAETAEAAAAAASRAGGATTSIGPVAAASEPVCVSTTHTIQYRRIASSRGNGGGDGAAGPDSATGRSQAAAMWVAGPQATAMECRSDAEFRNDVEALLDAFPAVQQQVPHVQEVYRTTWGTDPLFRGSYSYVAANSSLDDIEELGRPVGPLLFCGEATHTSHYGTAHGAFLTGEREADRLLGHRATS